MTLDAVVISRQIIKPSSPTPDHLTTFKISLIDQCTPPIGIPIILFYSAVGNHDRFVNTKMSDLLRSSLSKALTIFYPLAGRLKDNNSIVCDDSGIDYSEAQVNCRLYQLLNCPDADALNQLIPMNLHCKGMSSVCLLAVQINIFECGGMAITACMSHNVADTATLCTFVRNWAAIARGERIVDSPDFESATLFPPGDVPSTQLGPPERLAVRRFVFHSSKIDLLKAKAADKSYVENPTRVEAVSALIWKCFMNVTSLRLGCKKLFMANTAVNLRSRMVPPLSDNSFGNLTIGAMPSSPAESDDELHYLVGKLREAIRKVETDCSKNLHDGEGVTMFMNSLRHTIELFAKGEVGFFTITSWCRFPFYEADFGWGKPIWTSCLNMVHKNVAALMDTKFGDGIEAVITLGEEDMVQFECEQDLLAYAEPTGNTGSLDETTAI